MSDDTDVPQSTRRPTTDPGADRLPRLGLGVSEAATFDEALTILLRELCEQGGWSVGQAWRRRMRDAMLECAPAFHTEGPGFESFRAATLAHSFERGGGLPGQTWAAGMPRWVDDVRIDPSFRRRHSASAAGLSTGLFLPVSAGGEVIAVLELFATEVRACDEATVAIACAAADRLAPFLDRQRLGEQAELVRTALDRMGEALVVTTATRSPAILFVSQALERMTGWAPGELTGRSVVDLLLAAEDGPKRDRLMSAIGGQTGFFGELATSRRDGGTFPCEWSVSVADPTDESSTAILVLRDITTLSRAQRNRERLADSVRKAVVEWQRTFDAIDTPIWLCELDGQVVRLNRHARNLSDVTYGAAVGHHLSTLGTGEPWATGGELLRRVAESGAIANVQVRDELTRRTWDLVATVVEGTRPTVDRQDTGRRVLLVARDISRIVSLQESLHKSETMATMGAIVAGVAHEVRNPLFGISATIDALELRLDDASPYREYTAILRSEVGRLTTLMTDLLEYGRPPRLDLRKGSVAVVIEEAIRASSALAHDAGVVVQTDVALGVPPVEMDAARLAQVFRNLLDNAIQHSKRGDVVRLEARVDSARETVVCSVRDHGKGISEEDLPHIFEPFFTRRRGGVGLGLSLVWRIVEEHGGTTVAGRAPGGGAVITVTLPLERKKEES